MCDIVASYGRFGYLKIIRVLLGNDVHMTVCYQRASASSECDSKLPSQEHAADSLCRLFWGHILLGVVDVLSHDIICPYPRIAGYRGTGRACAVKAIAASKDAVIGLFI